MIHSKKHIAVLLQGYTQGKSGGDIACIRIINHLPRNRYTIHVFTSQLGKQCCIAEGLHHVTYHVTSHEKAISHLLLTYISRIQAFKTMRITSYETVYVSSDSLPDVLSAYILRTKIPAIRWVQKIYHPIPVRRFRAWIIQQIMWYVIKRAATTVITSSKHLSYTLIHKGFLPEKTVTNYLGVDRPAPTIPKMKQSKNIVFIGRLHASKGIFDLITAWKTVHRKVGDAHLTIIGSGSLHMRNSVQREIARNRLCSSITLAGYCSDRKTWTIAQKSAAVVMPSYEEGFSLTIATACAYHIPVIAYFLPIYQELFPKQIIPVQKGNHITLGDVMINTLCKKSIYKKRAFYSPYRWAKSAHIEKKYI